MSGASGYSVVNVSKSTNPVFLSGRGGSEFLVRVANTSRQLDPEQARKIRFHDLRHTAARLLLALDTRPKVVQELLVHSQIAVTMDVYSHVLPTMQHEAMNGLDKLLRG